MWDWLLALFLRDEYIPQDAFRKLEKAVQDLEALIKGTN